MRTKIDRKAFFAAYRKGMTRGQLAELFCCYKTSVDKIIREEAREWVPEMAQRPVKPKQRYGKRVVGPGWAPTAEDVKRCRKCHYAAAPGCQWMCNYSEITGQVRGGRPGTACEKFRPKKGAPGMEV